MMFLTDLRCLRLVAQLNAPLQLGFDVGTSVADFPFLSHPLRDACTQRSKE